MLHLNKRALQRIPRGIAPDTIILCGWSGCEAPVRFGRLVCAAHLDAIDNAMELNRNRQCSDCGEPSLFGGLAHKRGALSADRRRDGAVC